MENPNQQATHALIPASKESQAAMVARATEFLSTAGVSAKDAENIALNAAVDELDTRAQAFHSQPHVQMALLMLAQVKAFRRLMKLHNVTQRGKRWKMMKLAAQDFTAKLTQYGVDHEEPNSGA